MMNKFSFLTGGIASNNENPAKAGVKSVPIKRRVLGDITNACNEEERDGNIKKNVHISQGAATSEEMVVFDETRPYMHRPCDEIDSRDCDNPLLVTCYVDEIYEHFGALEKDFMVSSNYMMKQEFINDKMRSILVDWLVRI
jgi:hypothetical protein